MTDKNRPTAVALAAARELYPYSIEPHIEMMAHKIDDAMYVERAAAAEVLKAARQVLADADTGKATLLPIMYGDLRAAIAKAEAV
jgi:hypothetical protein